MDNYRDNLSDDKRSEYLFNEIKAGYNSQIFYPEDFTLKNGVMSLTFCALKNSQAQADITFSGLGAVRFYINGVPMDEVNFSAKTQTLQEFFVEKGDNVLSMDISGATDFSLATCNIGGYIKRKATDSKIYAANGTDKSLFAKFNAVKNVGEVFIYSNSLSLLESISSCKGVALSALDENKFVAAFLKSNGILLKLIDLRYEDIMSSAEISLSGALQISGGADGVLYVVAGDKSLKKYSIDDQLDFTCSSTGKRVNKVICSPQCSFYIVVGLDGKAYTVEDDP